MIEGHDINQQAQWQPPEATVSLVNFPIPVPKTRLRKLFKISLFFVGITLFIFFSVGVGLYATNTSNLGGLIGLGVGSAAAGVTIYLFFHKKYHTLYLRWRDYLWWILGITGVLLVPALIVSNVPYTANTKQTLYVLLGIIFLLYSASLIWITFMKPSLRQQVINSVRSILKVAPEQQIAVPSLLNYLQQKYATSEEILKQYIGTMEDIEQIPILGATINVYRVKPRHEVLTIPPVLQTAKPAQVPSSLPQPNLASDASIQKVVTPPTIEPNSLPPITQQPSAQPHIPQTVIHTSVPPTQQEKRTVTVFFCYARTDETLLKRLKAQLLPLQKQGIITMWYDRDISAGLEWEHEINEQLNTAEVILLLVSPDFLASDYCYSKEMQKAIERHERGEVCAIPIILRPCDWQLTPLSKLQALPKDGKPIITWSIRDNAYLDAARGIRKAVEELVGKSSK